MLLICRLSVIAFLYIESILCFQHVRTLEAGLTIVASGSVPTKEYSNLAKAMSQKVSIGLSIKIVKSMHELEEHRESLRDYVVPHFIFVHSLKSNYEVQKKVFSNPAPWAGVITFGSCLLPEFREEMHLVPLMCINGENDGIFRPLRSAESYYHIMKRSQNRTKTLLNHPVIYLEGLNHGSVLNTNIRSAEDLISPIGKLEGYTAISTLVGAFIERGRSEEASNIIIQSATESEARILPMVNLLYLEANIRLKHPCDSDRPSSHCPFYPMYPMKIDRKLSNDKDCQCGTPWVSVANMVIGSRISESIRIMTTDAIHPMEMMNPIHHPHIWNDCMYQGRCVLNITTVSNTIYDEVDEYDVSNNPYISGKEIAVKLKSEDSIWEAVTGDDVDPSPDINICQEINKVALNVALGALSNDRRVLYNQFGQKIFLEPDEVFLIEPLWSLKPLSIKTESRGKDDIILVTSPSFRTSAALKWKNVDLFAGMHYCKLASPARLFELMHTDNLKKYFNSFE